MGKPERSLQRKRNKKIQKSTLDQTLKELGSIDNLKAVPELLQEALKANQHIAEENVKLQEVLSETLESHEKDIKDLKQQVADLRKAVTALAGTGSKVPVVEPYDDPSGR